MLSEKLANVNDIGKALSDPNRVRALMALRKGELCVCQIIELLNLAPSTVSKHMSILRQAGLVESRKDSRWVYYRIPGKTKSRYSAGVYTLLAEHLEKDETVRTDDIAMKRITKRHQESVCQ